MTTTETRRPDYNDVALTLIAAARHASELPDQLITRRLLESIPADQEPRIVIASGVWLARWLAGRAGLTRGFFGRRITEDDPAYAARTLLEIRNAITFSSDPETNMQREVMLRILGLVELSRLNSSPPRADIDALLALGGAEFAELQYANVLLRLVELIQTLGDLDDYPGRLLDYLASEFMTTDEEGESHEPQ